MTYRPPVTPDEWARFGLFGYVVLRGLLRPDEVAALTEEVDRELRAGFGDALDERPHGGGIEGHYLPMLRPAAPLTCALVEDDRFWGAAVELLDGAALLDPVGAQAVLYYRVARWHCDDGRGVRGVKFVAYLDPTTADAGALRLLPLSHKVDQRSIGRWVHHPRVPIADVPGQVVETEPGDVIAFDLHTFHANPGGRDRRQWTVTYLRDPAGPEDEERVRAALAEGPGYEGNPFPPGYAWLDPAWVDDPAPSKLKRRWVARLRELGAIPT